MPYEEYKCEMKVKREVFRRDKTEPARLIASILYSLRRSGWVVEISTEDGCYNTVCREVLGSLIEQYGFERREWQEAKRIYWVKAVSGPDEALDIVAELAKVLPIDVVGIDTNADVYWDSDKVIKLFFKPNEVLAWCDRGVACCG